MATRWGGLVALAVVGCGGDPFTGVDPAADDGGPEAAIGILGVDGGSGPARDGSIGAPMDPPDSSARAADSSTIPTTEDGSPASIDASEIQDAGATVTSDAGQDGAIGPPADGGLPMCRQDECRTAAGACAPGTSDTICGSGGHPCLDCTSYTVFGGSVCGQTNLGLGCTGVRNDYCCSSSNGVTPATKPCVVTSDAGMMYPVAPNQCFISTCGNCSFYDPNP